MALETILIMAIGLGGIASSSDGKEEKSDHKEEEDKDEPVEEMPERSPYCNY